MSCLVSSLQYSHFCCLTLRDKHTDWECPKKNDFEWNIVDCNKLKIKKKLNNNTPHNLCCKSDMKAIKFSMRSARHVAHTQQMKNTYEIFSRKPERVLGEDGRIWKNSINTWTEFIWLCLQICGGILWTFWFHRRLGVSCVAERLLASQRKTYATSRHFFQRLNMTSAVQSTCYVHVIRQCDGRATRYYISLSVTLTSISHLTSCTKGCSTDTSRTFFMTRTVSGGLYQVSLWLAGSCIVLKIHNMLSGTTVTALNHKAQWSHFMYHQV